MGVMPKVIYESDQCKVYLWDGVTPAAPGESLECATFTPRELQVEGDFLKAFLDASCGGEWEPVVSIPMARITRISTEAIKVRPRIEGSEDGTAKFYLVVRR